MNSRRMLLALLITAGPGLAVAANEVRFEGQVSVSTCNVVVNGSATPIVLLPTVPSTALANPGSKTGTTAFNIALSDCPAPAAGRYMKTVFTGNNVTPAGKLGNTGTAANVDLEIDHVGGSGTGGINLTNTWYSTSGEGIPVMAGASTGNRDYYVRYVSVPGGATPGTVRASLQYAVIYP